MSAENIHKYRTKVTLDDGSVLDLDVDEDWNGQKLNKKQKLFVFWFTYPYDKDLRCYHHSANAARMAGYKPETARQTGYILKRKFKDLIEKFDGKYKKVGIDEAVSRFIQRKIARAEYDVNDFYREEVDDKGRVVIVPKSFEELTKEQRLIVDNVDNKNGMTVYQLPNRSKEMDSIIELKERMDGTSQPGAVNINVLVEQMKIGLSQSLNLISQNQQIAMDAGAFMTNPVKLLEEE